MAIKKITAQVGRRGKSAYEVAVENGFSGSRAQWLASLNGASAYQVAVANGFDGNEADWLLSLVPDLGVALANSGYIFTNDGTNTQWVPFQTKLNNSLITILMVDSLRAELDNRTLVGHTHEISNINGLVSALSNKIETSLIGAANGLATLDQSGLVPASQLPSYVDDVIEFETVEAMEATTGESGKIYVIVGQNDDNGKIFRWSGSVFFRINDAVSSADVAARLASGRTISFIGDASGTSQAFDGTQNITAPITVETASKLRTPRAINGVNFDGTAPITILAERYGRTNVSSPLTLLSNRDYYISQSVTVLLPTAPVIGDTIRINKKMGTTPIISGNGNNITNGFTTSTSITVSINKEIMLAYSGTEWEVTDNIIGAITFN